MRALHSSRTTWLALAAGLHAALAFGQQMPPVAPTLREPASTFTIFVGGLPVGTELIAVTRAAGGWTITGSGRVNQPIDLFTRRLEIRYDANWKPLELTLDAALRNQPLVIRSRVNGSTITSEITNGLQTESGTITADVDVLAPNLYFAPYEAVAARLRTAPEGSTLMVFAPTQPPYPIRVGASNAERIQTATQLIETRHTSIVLEPEGGAIAAELWADMNGRLLRLRIPSQGVEAVRQDVASVAARHVPISRPNDEQVKIPSNGFSLVGTISRPAMSGTKPLAAVVFVGGSGAADRDQSLYGIPILGQLAGAVADAGFLTLRYDKRGVGQSGGRLESSSLNDLAEDLVAAVRMVAKRKDVDDKRIAVVGHSEGGAVALLAAAREKRIAAVGLLATYGVSGADLILEQQQYFLGRTTLSEEDKRAKVELQQRINQAVMTGTGWDNLPPDLRRQSDTLEFQSILTNDPSKVLPNVRQPLLIVQGDLDKQVAPVNAERLEALARKRKNSPPVEVARITGVNHLLTPAVTGEPEEYATLKEKHISPAVSTAVSSWLQKTLPAK